MNSKDRNPAVTSSQTGWLSLEADEKRDQVRAIAALLEREIPAYGRIAASAIEADLQEVVRLNLDLYVRALRERALPSASELAAFEAVCGRRLRQGFPLEAVMRAGRLEIQSMWELIAARAPRDRLPELASLTLGYMDAINTASERGYVHAREDLGRSRSEAVRLFLSRLLRGDFVDDAEAAREARVLDFDLDRFRIGVVVEPEGGPDAGRSALDMQLVEAADELRRRLASSPVGLFESGLVIAAAATSVDDVSRLVVDVLEHPPLPATRLLAAVGSPRAGSTGLRESFREAKRALALGRVLNPGSPVHTYDRLRVFDLFKEDSAVDSYVQEMLGRLLAMDGQRHTHMLETLDAFFSSGMTRKAAASRLGIHANTLDYRLAEIEKCLGHSVRSGSDSFPLQLALKLLPLANRSASGHQAWR
jgi:hypothetical protein